MGRPVRRRLASAPILWAGFLEIGIAELCRPVLSRNTETAVSFSGAVGGFGSQDVIAVGNVWNANTQGADGFGVYPQPSVVVGPQFDGTNFRLGGPRTQIRLGRTLVAKVAARDDKGTRQRFRKAGRVRVLAR